ncbi:hypothetical protein FVP74_11540 [Microbacterium saccharophilum]|uniref:Uncharacterized protein n=1 Tax=Microbacterium saccharophilum TaxID=1213358 RepID=A0A5C8HVW8_9MICO|nr:hypothetical protein [Microbacterium saccharophilum]TXK09143.1 hypothetical protein FVP74_11540 [Microbacterium saccharophilum]GEP47684.1 hypothetical protein MSA03_11920 [Microbacterium saccharophilum]
MTDLIARTIRRSADAAGSVTVALAPHTAEAGGFRVYLGDAYVGDVVSRTTQTRKRVPGTQRVLTGAVHVEWVAAAPEAAGRCVSSHLVQDDAIRALLALAASVPV